MLKLMQARSADFERLREFYNFVIDRTDTMPVYCRWVYGQHPTDEMIRRYIAEGEMFYAEADGTLLSAVALQPCQGEDYHEIGWMAKLADDEVLTVHILCVNPERQKQGIARQTMEAAEQLGKLWSKKAIRLDALESNLPAQSLYEGLGFTRRDMKNWYACNVGWTNFILYEKQLAE